MQVLSAVDDPTWRCDVWSQIGHVYELKRDVPAAKSSYMKALDYNQVHYTVVVDIIPVDPVLLQHVL
jgi:hypothetical protein